MGRLGTAIVKSNELFTEEEIKKCDTRPIPPLRFFTTPKDNNEKLFNLQFKLYMEPEKFNSIFWEMWQKVGEIARNIIRAKIKRRKLCFSPDEIEDKVSNATEYFMSRYQGFSRYVVKDNFIIQIQFACQHALDYHTDFESKLMFCDFEATFENYTTGDDL